MGALAAAAWTTADPDLWGHVRFGSDAVRTGALKSADPYSFTTDRAWINHEWLSEVVMYGAYAAAGPPGLVTLKLVLVLGVLTCILARFRAYSWSPVSRDLLIGVALAGMLPRYHPVRPQLFSLLLFAVLLGALIASDRGSRRALIGVPIIFALWANLHGGFLVGLAVLALWIGVRTLENLKGSAALIACGIASLAATLLTPYGYRLWQFILETVGFGRPAIRDWQPIWSAGLLTLILWIGVAITGLIAVIRVRGQIESAALAIVIALGIASIRVSRIDAFFAISVVMLLGPVFALQGAARARPHLYVWTWAASAAIVAAGLFFVQRRASCIEVSDYPEPESVAFLQQQRGRLLTHFDWGQYAIWHLSPGLLVSIDGRRETVYSEDLVDAHLRFYANEPGSMSLVDRLQPDFIWLPTHLAVIRSLENAGWRRVFGGPISTVLSQRVAGDRPPDTAVQPLARCFPDA